MEKILFFKASLKKPLENVDQSTKSLHHRRSILILDHITETIWIVNGKNISDDLIKSAKLQAKKLLKEEKLDYELIDKFKEKNTELVNNILKSLKEKKSSRKKAKKKIVSKKSPKSNGDVPKVPSFKDSTYNSHILKGDLNVSGPQIEEFQISYIPFNDLTDQNLLKYGVLLMQELYSYSIDKISNSEFQTRINEIIVKIIEEKQ